MGQLKEADFIRWGSTKRMTSLRKAEQDGIWEGIKERTSAVELYLVNSDPEIYSQIISMTIGV
jgi:autophagy-related protein 5